MSSDSDQLTNTVNNRFSRREANRVVVASLDGVAPRFISPERMPSLARIVRSGGGCFTARTVDPPLTRPVHASMLRGVDPQTHGLVNNDLTPVAHLGPSILAAARENGLTTASFNNWRPLDTLIEPTATTYRCFIDSGYDPAEDDLVVDLFEHVNSRQDPDVSFVYLCRPDLVGHDCGFGSEPYLDALSTVDLALERLADAADNADLVVTTDHGGHGTAHNDAVDEVMTTFIAVRSNQVQQPGSFWSEASVLDVAPTVADLAGFTAPGRWQGRSLIGRQRPMVEQLISLLAESAEHSYGEDLSMLDHALQSASAIEAAGGDDDLVAAALLHDIGHLLGPAGAHGYPDHAEAGALFLKPWLPAPITEPIRLHVAAKRHLVAVDPDYHSKLSRASQITLEQQGGPFDAAESKSFLAEAQATRAMQLRRCDDLGKEPGLEVKELERHRPRIETALSASPVDPTWARDACRCPECRDETSDQHLLDMDDVGGWTVLGTRRTNGGLHVELSKGDQWHVCQIPPQTTATDHDVTIWNGDFNLSTRRRDSSDVAAIAADVAEFGVAHVGGVSTEPGSVLSFAETLGFVRETNYGRLFEVRTEPSAINLAYTPLALPLHTDNPYRDPVPTVQILHCLHGAAEGGVTLLADGFAAAEALREQDAGAFELLSNIDVCFRFHDETVDLRSVRRVIDCTPGGAVQAIYLNHRSLETPTTERYRSALAAFVRMLERFTIELTLADGEAIAFDNRRILHARTGFDPSSGRHLQGCYVDIDALRSSALVKDPQLT